MSVYKRGSGRYQVLIDLEPTALGGRLRKALGCFRTPSSPKPSNVKHSKRAIVVAI